MHGVYCNVEALPRLGPSGSGHRYGLQPPRACLTLACDRHVLTLLVMVRRRCSDHSSGSLSLDAHHSLQLLPVSTEADWYDRAQPVPAACCHPRASDAATIETPKPCLTLVRRSSVRQLLRKRELSCLNSSSPARISRLLCITMHVHRTLTMYGQRQESAVHHEAKGGLKNAEAAS